MDNQHENKKVDAGFVGFALLGLSAAGVGGFVVTFMSIGFEQNYIAAGVCLIASALSFGLMLNACLRN